MSTSLKQKKILRLQAYVFNLLFIAVIGLIAWLSTVYSFSSDWTYGQRNSLTETTVRLLEKMPDDIHMNIYLPDPSPSKAAIETLLTRYQQHKSNFHFRILNPDLDVDVAKADNISRYGQATIKYQSKRETLDSFNESLIGNALSRLSRSHAPNIVFLNGHGERDINSSDPAGYGKLNNALTEKGFAVSQINLINSPLPANTDILVIAGAATKYLDGEIEQINKFIAEGGNTLLLADPDSTSHITSVSDQLQIAFAAGTLVDADPQLRATLRIQHPATIAVLQYNVHPITERIPYNTLFMLAGVVDFVPSDKSEWSGTTLFSSRETTWAETGTLLTKEIHFESANGDQAGPLPMAQALERNVTSGDNSKTQRAVVIADSDFLANNFVGAGANLLLGQNIFNWLSQDEQLLSFDIKSAPDLQLSLSDTSVTVIGLLFLVILPVSLMVTGLFIWRRRKRG